MGSKEILCARGSFYESQTNPDFDAGMFELFPPLESDTTPILINNAIIQKEDIAVPEAYLNNKKLFFNFGQSWGSIKISGEILLGTPDFDTGSFAEEIGKSLTNGLRAVESYYSLFRASNHKKPLILSALKYAKPIKFFLIRYRRGKIDAELNIVNFALEGVVIDSGESNFLSQLGIGDTALAGAGNAVTGLI